MTISRKILGAITLFGSVLLITARAEEPCAYTNVPKGGLCTLDKVGNCANSTPIQNLKGFWVCTPGNVLVAPPPSYGNFECTGWIPVTMGSPPPTICTHEQVEWLWPLEFYTQDRCYDQTACSVTVDNQGNNVCIAYGDIETILKKITIATICVQDPL